MDASLVYVFLGGNHKTWMDFKHRTTASVGPIKMTVFVFFFFKNQVDFTFAVIHFRRHRNTQHHIAQRGNATQSHRCQAKSQRVGWKQQGHPRLLAPKKRKESTSKKMRRKENGGPKLTQCSSARPMLHAITSAYGCWRRRRQKQRLAFGLWFILLLAVCCCELSCCCGLGGWWQLHWSPHDRHFVLRWVL